MLKKLLVLVLFIGLLFFLAKLAFATNNNNDHGSCKHENSECQVNNSDKQCCSGLVCVPFNERSGNGKCQPFETPTPTATPSATPTPTITPTPTPECGEDCLTPTPTPEVTPEQTLNGGSGVSDGHAPSISTPTCNDSNPVKLPANFHIYRNGDQAIAKWFPTDGNKVNIYYKQVSSPVWQYSLADQPNNGYSAINGLGSLDITFGLQQENGCAGGIVIVVDSSSNNWVLFR